MRRLLPTAFAAAAAVALVDPRPAPGEPALAGARLYFGPSQEIVAADLAAIAGAHKSVDLAAYLLTDRDMMAALAAAGRRGVAVRIYVDRDEVERGSQRMKEDIAALATTPGVKIRYKARGSEAMHLKAYMVDRRLLRTGSANFTYSGERLQDNDAILLESPALAAAFARKFDAMWARADNEDFAR